MIFIILDVHYDEILFLNEKIAMASMVRVNFAQFKDLPHMTYTYVITHMIGVITIQSW